jgi:hypothetical protein
MSQNNKNETNTREGGAREGLRRLPPAHQQKETVLLGVGYSETDRNIIFVKCWGYFSRQCRLDSTTKGWSSATSSCSMSIKEAPSKNSNKTIARLAAQ